MKNIAWFQKEAEPILNNYTLKYVTGTGYFGTLNGVQIDSEVLGGYIYFWGNGYVGLQLINYLTDEELVEDTLLKVGKDEVKIASMLEKMLMYLTE